MSEGRGGARDGRRGRILAAAGLALLALLITFLVLRPPEVTTVAPETRDIRRTLAVVGRVRPTSRAELGAPLAGVVREVGVRDGERVEAGTIVVHLDDREARAAVAEAEARLIEVEAEARAEIVQAERELEQAARDLERLRAVFAEGGLAQQRVEQAEQRASDADARLRAARASTDASSPLAVVQAARATLEAARARLALTAVRSPHDGTVLRRLVEPGDAVEPGRGLVAVVSDGPTEIVAFPSEDNLARLRIGAQARVSADAYPNDTFPATLAFIAPAVDPDQGTVEIRLSVDEPPDYLRPDMTLSVNVEAGRREGATVLPAEAVRGLGTGEPWIAVVEDGRMARRDVEIGIRGEAFVEILSDLEPGVQVVRSGADAAVGDRVRTASPPR